MDDDKKAPIGESISPPDAVLGEVVLTQNVKVARTTEDELSIKDTFRYYRPAIGWAFLFSLGVIMAGFDPQLVGTLIAIPRIQHDFGVQLADGSFVVQAQ
jgi:SP family general alpha glucoside:H+ symporter-like MFS transporter